MANPKHVDEKLYYKNKDEIGMDPKEVEVFELDRAHNSKKVRDIISRVNNYDETKKQIIASSKSKLGFDFLNHYGLPDGFEFPTEAELKPIFSKTCAQKISMPFSDAQFDSFLQMKKLPWGAPIVQKVDGLLMVSQLMTGYDSNDQLCLFRFMVKKNKSTEDYSLKMDMCVGGKEWITIIRLDTKQPEKHTEYFDKNGNFVENGYQVSGIHLHTTNECSQVIFENDLNTTFASHDRQYEKHHKNETAEESFASNVKRFKNRCAIASQIDNFVFSHEQSPFDLGKVSYSKNVEDIKQEHIRQFNYAFTRGENE